MAAVIRLKKYGAKKKHFFRVVVCDKKMPRNGRPIEQIGYYDPKTNPAKIEIKVDRAKYWLGVGAQPSVTVKSIFKKQRITK